VGRSPSWQRSRQQSSQHREHRCHPENRLVGMHRHRFEHHRVAKETQQETAAVPSRYSAQAAAADGDDKTLGQRASLSRNRLSRRAAITPMSVFTKTNGSPSRANCTAKKLPAPGRVVTASFARPGWRFRASMNNSTKKRSQIVRFVKNTEKEPVLADRTAIRIWATFEARNKKINTRILLAVSPDSIHPRRPEDRRERSGRGLLQSRRTGQVAFRNSALEPFA
jgi:hypothetical protein